MTTTTRKKSGGKTGTEIEIVIVTGTQEGEIGGTVETETEIATETVIETGIETATGTETCLTNQKKDPQPMTAVAALPNPLVVVVVQRLRRTPTLRKIPWTPSWPIWRRKRRKRD